MKKLFAMFMSFIMALSNNVGYQEVADKPFATAGGDAQTYYTVAEVDEPDYRQMYNDDVPVASDTVSCKTRKFSGKPMRLEYNIDGMPYLGDSDKGVWLVDNEVKSLSELDGNTTSSVEVPLPASSDGRVKICAPYACMVQVSSKTNDGKSITVSCTRGADTYIIQISNILGWWCCAGKTNLPEPHNCMDELKGTVIQQGEVLAVGQGSVTVSITLNDKGVSLQDFYKGTDPNK